MTLDVDAGVVDVDAGAEAGDAALAADVALLDGGLLVDAGVGHHDHRVPDDRAPARAGLLPATLWH
ncbi:MAG: hypothetical protein U0235_00615 [Polyangiaceae bacterium]